MGKKVLISTGGTGGHVYPAIALAEQLKAELPDCEVLFIGGNLGSNRYFDKETYDHHTVACGAFIKKSPKAVALACFNIIKGVLQSFCTIRTFKPDLIVGFGSYFSFPPLIAAKLVGLPIILHEANSIPGKVIRFLAPWSEVVGVHFPETVHLLKGTAIEVGMPLRNKIQHSDMPASEARNYFGLSPTMTTLLVFGGSQGANIINLLIAESLVDLQPIQILHFTGDSKVIPRLQKTYEKLGINACVKVFEENMQMAWQASDLVISRSGAGTIAEQLEFEVPGILIPYARAADNHQEHNADFIVSKVGGAVKMHEHGLSASRLNECLKELLKDDCCLISAMKQLMHNYKKTARKRNLCSLVKDQLES